MIIKISINKSKAIKRFILFMLLLLLFLFMSVRPELFVKGSGFGFVRAAGYIGSVIFIICAAFFAQKVFSKKPGLIIDNDGVIDNSMGVLFAKVNWAQVTEIKHLESNGRHYIPVFIKKPGEYIAAEQNPMKRKMLELTYNTLKTPVNIAADRLKIEFDELFARIKAAHENYQ
ncbi:MAG: STM3941 family protein [Niabella sp.]